MNMTVRLANPALIFVYSAVLLLIGCAIGIHWSKNPGIAVWVALSAALLMVIHDLLEGMIWMGVLAKWTRSIHKQTESDSQPGAVPNSGSRTDGGSLRGREKRRNGTV